METNEYQIKIEFKNSSDVLEDLRKKMILSQMIEYMNGEYDINLLTKSTNGCLIRIKGISETEIKEKLIPLLKKRAGDYDFRFFIRAEAARDNHKDEDTGRASKGENEKSPDISDILSAISEGKTAGFGGDKIDSGTGQNHSDSDVMSKIHSLVGAEAFQSLCD